MSKEKIELFTDIDEEFSNINIQIEDLKSVIEYSRANGHQQVSETEKWIFETVCASSIEKIYSGIERVLIWIGIVIDGNLQPDGELGNKVTLDRMGEEILGVYGVTRPVIANIASTIRVN